MRISETKYAQLEGRLSRRPKPARLPVPSEHDEQAALIQWATLNIRRLPDLEWLFAIPNGGYRPPSTLGKLSKEGIQPGVPDLFLPVPRGDWHGLWLELKKADHSNHPSPQQKYWIDGLRRAHYMVVVCYGADEAIRAIETYLGNQEVPDL